MLIRKKRTPQIFSSMRAAILLTVMILAGSVADAQTAPAVNYEGENVAAIDLASRPEADDQRSSETPISGRKYFPTASAFSILPTINELNDSGYAPAASESPKRQRTSSRRTRA